LAESYNIGVGGFVEPFAALDELLPKISEMRDRAAERGEAKFQEREKDLADTLGDGFHGHAVMKFRISSPRR
jgi:hypothetical protein